MLHFDEAEFSAHLDTVDDIHLVRGLLCVRNMLDVEYLEYSPIVDELSEMEECYHKEIFLRFACITGID